MNGSDDGSMHITLDASGARGVQAGDHNIQHNYHGPLLRAPDQVPVPARLVELPREPVDPFVGRAGDLETLRTALDGPATTVVTQAVFGLGGVGKSELALQYAARSTDRHALIWWAAAESPETLQASLQGLAHRLEPAHTQVGSTTEEAADWAAHWLQVHPGWLLILDNVEDRETVTPLLAQVRGRGRVIVTTRRDINWRGAVRPLSLDVLAADDAVTLLASLSGRHGEGVVLAELAAELGYLPLALEQAGAYIFEQRISVATYLRLLRDRPAEAFQGVDQGGQASRTVARVWDIALTAIHARDESAAFLLEVLAYFAPDAIPRRHLTAASADAVRMDRALGVLASYSMITLDDETVSLHRLVQAVLRERARHSYQDVGQAGTPAAAAARILDEASPRGSIQTDVDTWPAWRELVPHIDALVQAADELATEQMASLLSSSAFFAWIQGQHHIALPREQRALRISEEVLGPDHPDVATRLDNLGATLNALGRPGEALPLRQRALRISEAALGPEHADVAIRLSNLASTLNALGRPSEALPLHQRALRVSEAVLSPDHPDIATRLNNLAQTFNALGESTEALPLHQRALRISEDALGPGHPDVATQLDNLASTLKDLGRADEALPLQQRALQISEAVLGPGHPDVAVRLSNLANLLNDLGQASEALPLHQWALRISEDALGPDHPDVAVRLNNLANLLNDLGQASEALPLHQRALRISEDALGPDHPDVAIQLNNLAATLNDLGRAGEALTLQQRAVRIGQATLGPQHPRVITMRRRLESLEPGQNDP